MRFEIEQSVLDAAPGIVIGIVVASGLDNSKPSPAVSAFLAECAAATLPTLAAKAKEDPRILPYREAFTALGINPNKYPCSIEALMSRLQKGGDMASINPVVDAGNAISIKRVLPIGAHDLGAIGTELFLRRARQGDRFTPFGSAESEEVDPGEVVYASGSFVRTRRWMWRQSEVGKIVGSTGRVFYPIDGFAGANEAEVMAARDELARLVERELGARTVLGRVDRSSPVFESRKDGP